MTNAWHRKWPILRRIAIKQFLIHSMAAGGFCWTVSQILMAFSILSPGGFIQLWWLFLIISITYSTIRVWPRKRFSYLISGRDISVELVIGDIFDEEGPVVVGSTVSFETSHELISGNSIQGQFTHKYCRDEQDVADQVANTIGRGIHSIGTTTAIKSNKKTGYFCAIARFNDNGVAFGTLGDITNALPALWNYIATKALKEIINVPILGSGLARAPAKREELFKMIVQSFVAATSEISLCDGIRIVVRQKDLEHFNIDEMRDFLKYTCRYSMVEQRPSSAGTSAE